MALSEKEKDYYPILREKGYYETLKKVAICYVFAALGILFLPFLERSDGATIAGFRCHQPYPYMFAGMVVIELVVFCWHSLKNGGGIVVSVNSNWRFYNFGSFKQIYPLVLLIISALLFLGGSSFFVEAWEESEKEFIDLFDEKIHGSVTGMNWWGPIIYCVFLLAAYCFTLRLNRIIEEVRK